MVLGLRTQTKAFGRRKKLYGCCSLLSLNSFSAGHLSTSSIPGTKNASTFSLTVLYKNVFHRNYKYRYAFDPASLYEQMGPTEIALIQLLAYLSSCCNPITYCFMNEKFRNAFLSAFGCGPQGRGFGRGPNRSTDLLSASFNDSFNLGRRSTKGKKKTESNIVIRCYTVPHNHDQSQ